MFAKAIATVAAATVLLTTAAFANPVGRYNVRGTNPGDGKPYSGQVEVTRTGDTYRVVWQIGGEQYVGTGIGNDTFMAVSYRAGSQTGIALYGRKANGIWEGVWTYAGGREIGTDRWSPRD